MPSIKIDDKAIDAPEGSTILEAARSAGIDIPTLCHLEGTAAWTSCMVCVVKLPKLNRLVPSCATRVVDGMVIESDTDEVRGARRTALELLLSDHLGDCTAPCMTACPAHMNIPMMIRHIAAGDMPSAIAVVKEHIALPAVLGRVCPAPCEKTCRRRSHDASLAIRLLKRVAADVDLAEADHFAPEHNPPSGRSVAIVGGGPAGLAATYYLAALGHACTIFDDAPRLGGRLRDSIPADKLPVDVLDAEITLITNGSCAVRQGTSVGRDVPLADLRRDHDAVFLAIGDTDPKTVEALGLDTTKTGVAVDAATQRTSQTDVFAGGACVRPTKLTVRSVADGRRAAIAMDQMLRGQSVVGERREWNCRVGKLLENEIEAFVHGASPAGRADPAGGAAAGLSDSEAQAEALRCLHCDCRSASTCLLRKHAQTYSADSRRYSGLSPSSAQPRRTFEQHVSHEAIVYEPGKCISCGICVRISEREREPLGLTFIGRGFDVRVKAPFDRSIAEGLKRTALECADSCPTGALARK